MVNQLNISMQFKSPEVFYFLFLLSIPLIVHLFQLQKFVKVPFTNVAFLQKIQADNRRSSTIKKWLLLCTRTLGLLALLFAFSKPYFSNSSVDKKTETFIYLDNSLSITTKNNNGNSLQKATQELIENVSKNGNFTLLTNTNVYKNLDYQNLKKQLLSLKTTPNQTKFEDILLKINAFQKNKTNTLYKNILISDFQNINKSMFTNVTGDFSLISLQPEQQNNILIDSIYLNNADANFFDLKIRVKNKGIAKNNIPIAIYNNTTLLSKQTFSIAKDTVKTLAVSIQKNKEILGKINITFSDTFIFDNSFYFNINNSEKTNVLSIGKATSFLAKIFTKDEFNFKETTLQNLSYNEIKNQELIILNELENIPSTLSKSIQKFCDDGGTLTIIPNEKSNLNSYNALLKKFRGTQFKNSISDTLRITTIHNNHPFFKNVFTKRVVNFQYPVVKNWYPIVSKKATTIVSFENNKPFFSQLKMTISNVYVFSSALNVKNSNIQNSPLIVPIFYTLGKLSFNQSKLYYRIHSETNINIKAALQKDEIVTLSNNNSSFIPLQKASQKKVAINVTDQKLQAGFYAVTKDKDTLTTLAFNNPKLESSLDFLDTNAVKNENKNIKIYTSTAKAFQEINQNNKVNWLWKWFILLAIVSLLSEILILKFFRV